jgi:hypothetical protein
VLDVDALGDQGQRLVLDVEAAQLLVQHLCVERSSVKRQAPSAVVVQLVLLHVEEQAGAHGLACSTHA